MSFRKSAYLFLTIIISIGLSKNVHSQPLPTETWFDFWVGEWEVHWDEGEGRTGRGTNTIEKILDGTVIQENFRITEGSNSGFKGVSLSVYHQRSEQWKQAWADNQGGYYDFTGSMDGEKRIFRTEVFPRDDGSQFTQRMVFFDITANSMTWDWESSEDGGQTWTLNWRIFYNRR